MSTTETEASLLGQFIPLHYHFQMLLDTERMRGFRSAIELLLPAGGTAVDLGGGTGVLSFFAAQQARRVWCVEQNPQMVEAARRNITLNSAGAIVEVVEKNAAEFIPPEPVDVVVCEMLHSALLREKQIAVIDAFKRNYQARFGEKLPLFIPEATLLAAQPVQQNFRFEGYYAPVPMFLDPIRDQSATVGLADPFLYSVVDYRKTLPEQFQCSQTFTIAAAGELNAVRFITKNVLAIVLSNQSTIDWHNCYLILPLKEALKVEPGTNVRVAFSYRPGADLESLARTLEVTRA